MNSSALSSWPILVSLGEPGGIGPEIVMRIWQNRFKNNTCPFIYLANQDFLNKRAQDLKLNINIITLKDIPKTRELTTVFTNFLPILDIGPLKDTPGNADAENGPLVLKAIKTAVELIHQQKASALVTAPINKKSLYDCGFDHPGHTEYLGELSKLWGGGPKRAIMMLAGPELRTIPATVHIPLKEVAASLNSNNLLELFLISHKEMQMRFGIKSPRIVVTGLNPHAGEQGSMGKEDDEIILPAIEKAQKAGLDIKGPLPADTLFHARKRKDYDVAIAMYHDQALLPVKTIAFDETVNVTLGLPFIRTSPDHGTALDIASKGIAEPKSMFSAIQMAHQMVQLSSNGQAYYK